MRYAIVASVLSAALLHFGVGCADQSIDKSLTGMQRDWNKTIRAAGVIPVYPMHQDLRPGDVFLIDVDIEDQQRYYKNNDYLPLPQHFKRLEIDQKKYNAFYKAPVEVNPPVSEPPHPSSVKPWRRDGRLEEVPRAAFPTFSTEVKSSAGLSLAIPIKGVQLGLGLLDAREARVNLSMSKATTYGLDIATLDEMVHKQIEMSPVLREKLAAFGQDPKDNPRFLRVVSRVFYIEEIDLTVQKSQSGAAGARGGVEIPLETAMAKLAKTPGDGSGTGSDAGGTTSAQLVENYDKTLKGLQTTLDGATGAGGRAEIVTATTSSVGMHEKFEQPIIVGYHAYDRVILERGELGPPVSTLVILDYDAYRFDQDANAQLINAEKGLSSFDAASDILEGWLRHGAISQYDPQRLGRLRAWLGDQAQATSAQPVLIFDLLSSPDHQQLRRRAVEELVRGD